MMKLVIYRMRKAPTWVREFLAETMGTFILLMFGIGSVAQYKFMGNEPFLSINFGWGLGCMFGVYWSAGVSGAHLNPAVTLAMVVTGRMKFRKLPTYWIAQSLGAFLASVVCYGVYYDLLMKNGGRVLGNAGIWSTYLKDGVSNATGFGDQVVGTALLVGTIFALTDDRNNPPKPHILPFIVGMLVNVIGMSFGVNAGYGINPARDLVPRLFTVIAGWGGEPFAYHDHWFWVAVAGQLVGGVFGAYMYIFTIEIHHQDREEKKEKFHSTKFPEVTINSHL